MGMLKLKVFGTSMGILIPKEMLVRMKVEMGATLFAVETSDGYLLSPHDPEIGRQVEIGRSFMKKYCETFKRLA